MLNASLFCVFCVLHGNFCKVQILEDVFLFIHGMFPNVISNWCHSSIVVFLLPSILYFLLGVLYGFA